MRNNQTNTLTVNSFSRQFTSQRRMLTPEYKAYPAHITIKHWQLRDLVCVNTKVDDEVLYPRDRLVYSLNLNTAQTKVVTEFDFEPRCIQTHNDIVAVGALYDSNLSLRNNSKGLFAVHNRQTNQNYSLDIGECINNSISLYSENPISDSSQVKAIVCNNDYNLYFVDIDNSHISISGKTKFKVALNHASISPDRKTIVACGDIQQLYVCHPECGNSNPTVINNPRSSASTSSPSFIPWSVTDVLDSWSSFGFSTAFHSSGVIFGAAFQSGVAHLYDMRNLSQPLTKIYSSRPREFIGFFRCLKFSQGLEDLVFVSEQMGRVHAVDLRDFDNHQILMVPKQLSTESGRHLSISGANNSQSISEGTRNSNTWTLENDPELIRQYDEMIQSGEALEFIPGREDIQDGTGSGIGIGTRASLSGGGGGYTSRFSHVRSYSGSTSSSALAGAPLLTLSGPSHTTRRSSGINRAGHQNNNNNHHPLENSTINESPFDRDSDDDNDNNNNTPTTNNNDDDEIIPQIPSSSVFQSSNSRLRRNTNTGAGWNDIMGATVNPTRPELISPVRNFTGPPVYLPPPSSSSISSSMSSSLGSGGGVSHTRSSSFGALATNRAAARRSLLLEQQLAVTYNSGSQGSFSFSYSPPSSLRASPALPSAPSSPGIMMMGHGGSNNNNNTNVGRFDTNINNNDNNNNNNDNTNRVNFNDNNESDEDIMYPYMNANNNNNINNRNGLDRSSYNSGGGILRPLRARQHGYGHGHGYGYGHGSTNDNNNNNNISGISSSQWVERDSIWTDRPYISRNYRYHNNNGGGGGGEFVGGGTTATGGGGGYWTGSRNPTSSILRFPGTTSTDYGVSGISWSPFEGGSLVVGSDRGIGVWKVDTLASRMFPNYEQR